MPQTSPAAPGHALSQEARNTYRLVIDSMLRDRRLPHPSNLPATAALRELQAADWLGFDANGTIVAPYPFALEETGVAVRLDGENVWHPVMCAVDALGIAPMLGQVVHIRSHCRQTGQPISISVRPTGIRRRRPASSVVIRRRTAGPAHTNRCDATHFAAAPHLAQAWIDANGTADDVIQSLEAAFIEARAIFGHRLQEPST